MRSFESVEYSHKFGTSRRTPILFLANRAHLISAIAFFLRKRSKYRHDRCTTKRAGTMTAKMRTGNELDQPRMGQTICLFIYCS